MKSKLAAFIFMIISVFILVACENNTDELDTVKTNRELFIEKYGYDIDCYSCLVSDELYGVLLQNHIEKWSAENRPISNTTSEMLECEETIAQKWEDEIEDKLNYLKAHIPQDTYTKLQQYVEAAKAFALTENMLSEDIMRDLEFYGSYSSVELKQNINDKYRSIAFELSYIQYIYDNN